MNYWKKSVWDYLSCPNRRLASKDSPQPTAQGKGAVMFFNFNRLLLFFPGRMALGKFGMWMVKVGEVLQLRYAGWNKKFRMKVDLYSEAYIAIFHVSELITSQTTLTFSSPGSQINKQMPFIQKLFAIQGIIEITVHPYEVNVRWAHVFPPEEMVPKIENVLIEAFTK